MEQGWLQSRHWESKGTERRLRGPQSGATSADDGPTLFHLFCWLVELTGAGIRLGGDSTRFSQRTLTN
jgi:hypothetical protein